MRERWYIPMMKSTESAGERRRAPSAFDQRLAARREGLEGHARSAESRREP